MTPSELRAIAARLNAMDRSVDQARAVTDAKIALHDAADEIQRLSDELDAMWAAQREAR